MATRAYTFQEVLDAMYLDMAWQEYRAHPCYQGESREAWEELQRRKLEKKRRPYVPKWAKPLAGPR